MWVDKMLPLPGLAPKMSCRITHIPRQSSRDQLDFNTAMSGAKMGEPLSAWVLKNYAAQNPPLLTHHGLYCEQEINFYFFYFYF